MDEPRVPEKEKEESEDLFDDDILNLENEINALSVDDGAFDLEDVIADMTDDDILDGKGSPADSSEQTPPDDMDDFEEIDEADLIQEFDEDIMDLGLELEDDEETGDIDSGDREAPERDAGGEEVRDFGKVNDDVPDERVVADLSDTGEEDLFSDFNEDILDLGTELAVETETEHTAATAEAVSAPDEKPIEDVFELADLSFDELDEAVDSAEGDEDDFVDSLGMSLEDDEEDGDDFNMSTRELSVQLDQLDAELLQDIQGKAEGVSAPMTEENAAADDMVKMALERVLRGKIDEMLPRIIEKMVAREIDRIKTLLRKELPDDEA